MLDFLEELYKLQRKSCRAGNLEAVNVKKKIPPKIWRRVFFSGLCVWTRFLEAPTQCHGDQFKARLMADVDTPWCFLDDSMMPCEPVIFMLGECEGRKSWLPGIEKKPFWGLWKAVVQKHSCVLIPAIRTGIEDICGSDLQGWKPKPTSRNWRFFAAPGAHISTRRSKWAEGS